MKARRPEGIVKEGVRKKSRNLFVHEKQIGERSQLVTLPKYLLNSNGS